MIELQADWTQPTAYERWYASSLGRSYGGSLRRILSEWLGELHGGLILDVGCGPGLTIEHLFPAEAEVVGMDCSWHMARRAWERSQRGNGLRQVVVGSIERMPFREESCDAVFCVNCLEFVEDRQRAFREIGRVLRPGGAAILGVLNRKSIWEYTRRMWRPFTSRPYYQGRFFRPAELQEWCASAGLVIEDLEFAVPFPPVPPGPLQPLYDRWDHYVHEHKWRRGGVILCRAHKALPQSEPNRAQIS